jgi:hypothetical protein
MTSKSATSVRSHWATHHRWQVLVGIQSQSMQRVGCLCKKYKERGINERYFVTQVTWLKFSVTHSLLHQTPSYFLEEDSRPSWPSTKFLARWTAAVFKSYRWRGIQVFGFHHAIRWYTVYRHNVFPLIQFGPTHNFDWGSDNLAALYILSVAELPANISHRSTSYTAAGLSNAHSIFYKNFRDTQNSHSAWQLFMNSQRPFDIPCPVGNTGTYMPLTQHSSSPDSKSNTSNTAYRK